MITYKKNSLKTEILFASTNETGRFGIDSYSRNLAIQVKAFIEKGEYKRIADISYYGPIPKALTCIIIYEKE